MKLLIRSLLIVVLSGCSSYIYAQSPNLSPINYKVTITGTSNLHAWDENVGKVTASAAINRVNSSSITIESLTVIISVYSIKSTEGHVMDNNTYKALKASAYPEIKYSLSAPVSSLNVSDGAYRFTAKGTITIAGVTRPVEMAVKLIPQGGKLLFEGMQKIKMTDYNITPPTAMFGMLKTGDEVTIDYNMVFPEAIM